jgi:hypothetical protein
VGRKAPGSTIPGAVPAALEKSNYGFPIFQKLVFALYPEFSATERDFLIPNFSGHCGAFFTGGMEAICCNSNTMTGTLSTDPRFGEAVATASANDDRDIAVVSGSTKNWIERRKRLIYAVPWFSPPDWK